MRRALAAIFIGTLPLTGCGNDPEATPAQPQKTADTPAAVDVGAIKPMYTLQISSTDSVPRQFAVKWSAQVNTGGYALTTDRVLVEEQLGKMTARIYATLEKPAPGEMTTQAIETLTGEHTAGTTQIDQAELSIRQTTRGDTSGFAALYSIVKRAP